MKRGKNSNRGGEKEKLPNINEEIRASEIRVVDEDQGQLGVMSVADAMKIAAEKELDVVEISPNAKPPVCKIIDFGKYRFEQQKRAKEAKKKQKVISVKEIKFRPKIDDHDYNFKLNHVKRFLEDGDKVKLTIMFRGREMTHTEQGEEILNKAVEDLGDLVIVEKKPKLEGRNMTMVVSPKAK